MGERENQSSPVPLNYQGARQLASGWAHRMMLKNNGEVWAHGGNNDGQLGIGSRESKSEPVLVTKDTEIESVFCGGNHSFYLKKNGELWATGNNLFGQVRFFSIFHLSFSPKKFFMSSWE